MNKPKIQTSIIALYLAAPLIVAPWVVAIGMSLKGLSIEPSIEYVLMATAIIAFSSVVAIAIPYTGHQWLSEKDQKAKNTLFFLFLFLLLGWLYLFSAYGFSHYMNLPINQALQTDIIKQNLATFLMFVFYGILGDGALVGILYVQSRKKIEVEEKEIAELEERIESAVKERNERADEAFSLKAMVEGFEKILSEDPAGFLPVELWRYLGKHGVWFSVKDLEGKGFDGFGGSVRESLRKLVRLGMIQEDEVSSNRFVYGRNGLQGIKGT